MLKPITTVLSILVCNIAAYNSRFPNHQHVLDYHWLHGHNSPHDHQSPHDYRVHHNEPRDHHQPRDWNYPDYVDDNSRAFPDNYDDNDYYPWPDQNSWNGNNWFPNQEIKSSSARPPTTPNPQPQIRPDFRIQCIRSCPVTPEYNPVCGSNYVLYDNIGKLQCAKYCGVDVTFMRNSICPPRPAQSLPIESSPTTSTTGVPPELSFDVRIKETN